MMPLLLALSAAQAASLDVYPGDDIYTLTQSLSAGSEVVFHDGTYAIESGLYLTGQGTEGEPITLRAADGERPVLEMVDGSYVIRVEDATHLTLEGLVVRGGDGAEETGLTGIQLLNVSNVTVADCEIVNVPSTGLYVAYDSRDVTLRGNRVHDILSSTAIYIGHSDASYLSSNVTIEGNWIHDIGDGYDYGVYLAAGTSGSTVRDNVIYGVNGYGVYFNSTEYGDPNVIEANAIWNISHPDGGGSGIGAEGTAQVRNNLVFNIEGYGIYSRNNGSDTLEDLVISFNTVGNTDGWGVRLDDWAGRPGMVFANNAVANPTGYALYAGDKHIGPDNYLSSNVVTGLVDGFDDFEGAFEAGAGFDDFSDVEGWDFYPVTGSALINNADPSSDAWVPQTDFNGAPREGDAPDVGAYEYSSGSNPGWAIREGFKELGLDNADGEQVTGGGCCEKNEESTEAGLLLLPGLLMGAAARRRRRKRAQTR